MPLGRLNTGLGLDITSLLSTAATVATAPKSKPGAAPIPSPMELYQEAAPRVITMLKQYDDAKPLIDTATRQWWLLVIGLGVIAVGGSYIGNVLYSKVHHRKV
jgi:hypothetical protein